MWESVLLKGIFVLTGLCSPLVSWSDKSTVYEVLLVANRSQAKFHEILIYFDTVSAEPLLRRHLYFNRLLHVLIRQIKSQSTECRMMQANQRRKLCEIC